MNSIVFPMKVLAVKLEYRRQKLERMVQGHTIIRNGKLRLVITRDPSIPKISARHQRVISPDTKLGKYYSDLINEYQVLKSEYDALLILWNSMYCISPPKVKFPIVQYSDPHGMNNEYYKACKENLGKYTPDNPTVCEHGELKSKNEQFGLDLLKDLGIPFKYEPEIYLKEIDETINPDCIVNFFEIDRCSYLEIFGMNDKIEYTVKTCNKIYGFSKEKYRPGREVIYVFMYDKYNFDKEYFVSQVLAAFDTMIPDDALIWEPAEDT